MKRLTTLTAALGGLAVVLSLTAKPVLAPGSAIDDIRMCAVEQQTDRCPTDNPVFERAAENITINVRSAGLNVGDEVRFTWYRLDDSEFFSTYLGSVYESIGASNLEDGTAVVWSRFPEGQDVLPGNYEVLVHTPGEARPVIKNFKVLD